MLMELLDQYQLTAADINNKEELIGWQVTEFIQLPEAIRTCKPYQ